MGIALIIVGGIVAICALGIGGDYLTKVKGAKPSVDEGIVSALERRISELEQKSQDQDKKIQNLESDVSFTNKLLEDKTRHA